MVRDSRTRTKWGPGSWAKSGALKARLTALFYTPLHKP